MWFSEAYDNVADLEWVISEEFFEKVTFDTEPRPKLDHYGMDTRPAAGIAGLTCTHIPSGE